MLLPIRYEVRRLYRWPILFLALLFWLELFVGVLLSGLAAYRQASHLWFFSGGVFLFAIYVSYVRRSLVDARRSGWVQAVILSGISIASLLFPLAIVSIIELLNEKKRARFDSLTREREAVLKSAVPVGPSEPAVTTHALVGGSLALVAMLFIANYLYQTGQTSAESVVPEYKVNMQMSIPELYSLGRACNSEGDSRCAAGVFGRILDLDPGDLTARANLAMAQTQMRQHEDARQMYRIYFERGGNGYDTMAYYARTLNALNDKDGALEWNMRALKAEPRLIDVAQSVTGLLIERHEDEKAIQFIDGFLKKNPSAYSYFENVRARLEKERRPATQNL